MRKVALMFGLTVGMFLMQGCISIHTEERGSSTPTTYESNDTTIQEINAAGMLSFEDDRQRALKRIAQRKGLDDTTQIHLVEAIFRRLDFEQSKVDVLMTLVKNSSFSLAAESAILDRLSQLSFEHDKSKVLDAISKRKQ